MSAIDPALVGTLYGAIEHDEAWVDVLDQLKVDFGAVSAVAQVLHANGPKMRELWTMRDRRSLELAALHDAWANSPANPRFDRPRSMSRDPALGSDYRDLPLSASGLAAMRRGLAGCGLGPGFWLDVALDADSHFTLIFHRAPGDDRDLGAAEEAALTALMPHIHRVVRLSQRIGAVERLAHTFDAASTAADLAWLVCDRDSRVNWVNSPARRVLARARHLALRDARLVANAPADAVRLRAGIAGALAGTPASLMLGDGCQAPLHLRMLPVAGAADPGWMGKVPATSGMAGTGGGQVLVLLSEPHATPALDSQALVPAFGLTPAEARLVAALAQGQTVQDHAAARGIAVGTARIQLKSALAKTGTARQAELVRLVCRTVGLAAGLTAP